MKPKILLCLTLVLNFFSAKIAEAQPGPFREVSLEAGIAQAQSVVRGVISNSTRTGTQDGRFRLVLTVQVDEVLKGPLRKTVEFAAEVTEIDEIKEWTRRRTPFLCFVNDPSGQDPAATNYETVLPAWTLIRDGGFGQDDWNVIRLGDAVPAEGTDNVLTSEPVRAMDTTYLSKAAEILERTREFAKSGSSTAKIDELDLMGLLLAVPVSPPLEAAARRMVRSPDGNGNGVNIRAAGVRALHYFKSAENIELLKPFLNDPGTITEVSELVWRRRWIYPVRKAAYDVLQEWGVTASKPMTAEVVPWHFDPAVRENLEVQIPTKLRVDRRTNLLRTFIDIAQKKDTTNVSAGSNMVIGVRSAWYVFPEGTPQPANASRLELEYTGPASSSVEYFNKDPDGLPVPGQKYNVELDYTLFETDNPPPSEDQNSWRPQDGKNYRILLQQTLKQKSE